MANTRVQRRQTRRRLHELQQNWGEPGIHGLAVGPARWSGVFLDADQRPAPPPIPSDVSSFAFFFEPLFPILGQWFLDAIPSPLWKGWNENPDLLAALQLLNEQPHCNLLPPGFFFPDFGRYVGEGDWMHLAFTRNGDLSPSFWNDRTNPEIWQHTEIWIHNIDGAFWLVHARDPSVLEIVVEHMQTKPGFDCQRVYPKEHVI